MDDVYDKASTQLSLLRVTQPDLEGANFPKKLLLSLSSKLHLLHFPQSAQRRKIPFSSLADLCNILLVSSNVKAD